MASSQAPQQANTDDDDGERFFRSYSKALAEALLENESGTKKVSKDQQIHDAYVALCYDEPRVESDEACRLLALELATDKRKRGVKKSYALSERLVEGIRQATSRTVPPASSGNNAGSTSQDDQGGKQAQSQEDQDTESFIRNTGTASASAYAALAVAAFIQVPLACCVCAEKSMIESFLGSYRGPVRQQQAVTDDLNDSSIDNKKMVANPSGSVQDNDEQKGAGNDHDSLAEIFADESDPDDFEFESAMNDPCKSTWDLPEMDPSILSCPPTTEATWTELRHAVANLLTELTYSKLLYLSAQKWKSLHVSDILTQLALTLLIPPTCDDHSNGNISSLLSDDADPACHELSSLGVQPLFCLRDRAVDASKLGKDEVLGEYLMLLQTMLGVDAALFNQQTKKEEPLAPATVIGLASLSDICDTPDSSKSTRQRIRKCVIENLEDLASILERVAASPIATFSPDINGKTEDESKVTDLVPTWVHVILTMLPLSYTTTNVEADGTSKHSTDGIATALSNREAQLLLNSGFFRQLILVYTRNHSSQEIYSSPTCKFARDKLLHAILVMCVQSPTILSKYAWRVPELSQLLSDGDDAQQLSRDCRIMWSLVGSVVLAGGGGRLRLVTRTGPSSNLSSTRTADSCRAEAVKSFEELCGVVMRAMVELQAIRRDSLDGTEDLGEWKTQHVESLEQFARFTNLVVSLPSFAGMWMACVQGDPCSGKEPVYTPRVKKHLDELRSIVSNMPVSTQSKSTLTYKDDPVAKSADNDKTAQPLVRVTDRGDEHVSAVQKGIKILSLLLREGTTKQGSNLVSKTD